MKLQGLVIPILRASVQAGEESQTLETLKSQYEKYFNYNFSEMLPSSA